MAKSFIIHERIQTTVPKAKELRKVVEPLITLAKEDTLTNRRKVIQILGIRYNELAPKEARNVKKNGDLSVYNDDRNVVKKLFGELGPKFKDRLGGYTRIVRLQARVGDAASGCVIESVQ